jgi:hypothetical protein
VSGPIHASQVQPEAVEWLWNERIPRGMISLVAGRPDQGKGLFAVHLAAHVSAAGGKVFYSAAEDSHSLMTRPRLEAAGADLDRVLLPTGVFQLPSHGRELAELVVDQELDLVVLDPLAAHLSGGISRFGDNIRVVLNPLKELIEQTGTAVVIIEHALKRVPKSGHPLDAIGGNSSGAVAASRAAFLLGVDPDNGDRRILAPAKFNIGPKPKAFAFEVEIEDIDLVGDVPLLLADEELLAFDPMRFFQGKQPESGKAGRPPEKRAAAAEWLTTYLADSGGPVHVSTILEDAKQWGMTQKTLNRAATDMEIVRHPPGGGRKCTWDLPEGVKELMGLLDGDAAATPDEPTPSFDDLDEGLNALLGGEE